MKSLRIVKFNLRLLEQNIVLFSHVLEAVNKLPRRSGLSPFADLNLDLSLNRVHDLLLDLTPAYRLGIDNPTADRLYGTPTAWSLKSVP